jgi:hypothetical protein
MVNKVFPDEEVSINLDELDTKLEIHYNDNSIEILSKVYYQGRLVRTRGEIVKL